VSLKIKVIFILMMSFLLTAGTLYGVQRLIVYPSFVSLEDREAAKDLNRGIDGIRRDIEHLSTFNNDWAGWDDSWNFVQGKNADFIRVNLQYNSFLNNRCDFQIYLDNKNKIYWQGGPDDTTKDVKPDAKLANEIVNTAGVMPKNEIGAATSGVIVTYRGPVFVSARTIVTSENTGPVAGVLIVARVFDKDEIANLSERIQVKLDAWPVHSNSGENLAGTLESADAQSLATLGSGKSQVIRRDPKIHDSIYAYAVVPGVGGEPALLLRANIPAEITAHGGAATAWATLSTILCGAVVVMIMWLLLKHMVIHPLQRVTRHAKEVGSSDNLDAKLGMNRTDEIGTLASEFDRMVEQLAKSRAMVVDSAHKSGMAEIASEVLHNVGNALNSVNVATQVIEERVRSNKVGSLNKATQLLADNKNDLPSFLTTDARGKKLVDYLIGLSDVFAAEQKAQLTDLATLQSRVSHINDVIAVQQSIATHKELVQNLEIGKILDDVLMMHGDQLAMYHIDVECEIGAMPSIQSNKSKLIQVLVNLVKNAIESIIEASPGGGRLIVRARAAENQFVEIEITDTGSGIDPANQKKLFSSGFTTKPSGHGIGLHFCANAVRAMEGTIQIQSEGLGRGATVFMRLPISRKEQTV
jgi:signal transduction histidine kinase